jgi:hypothetical protein
MKLTNRYRLPILVIAAVATTALAQVAAADPSCGRGADYRDSAWRDGWRGAAARRWSDSDERSYFYRDCQTGRTDAYISNLRPGYGRGARRARVEKVDRWSGRVIAAYVWDRDRWCDADGAGYTGRDDRGYDDRSGWEAAGGLSYRR